MDKFEKQRRIFSINAVLLLVSYIGLVVAIPAILQDIYPGSNPKQAAIATTVSACLHLLVFIGFLIGIRQAKRKRRINKEINIAAAIVTGIFGLVMLDGAFASLGHALLTSIGFFTCVICDLASALVSIAALFILSSKKKSQPA
jgi:uncharacterized membrane protein (DUF373 family)